MTTNDRQIILQRQIATRLVGAERIRLILLDLGGGDVVAFVFDSSDPSRFDELVADGMPIVESFTFN